MFGGELEEGVDKSLVIRGGKVRLGMNSNWHFYFKMGSGFWCVVGRIRYWIGLLGGLVW